MKKKEYYEGFVTGFIISTFGVIIGTIIYKLLLSKI